MSRAMLIGFALLGLALHLIAAQPQDSSNTGAVNAIDEPSGAAATEANADTSLRLSEPEIQILNEIRQSLQNHPLRDAEFLTDKDAEGADFSQQLRDDFGDPAVGVGRPPADAASDRAAQRYRQRSLRSLSRRLDALAIDLYEIQCFDDADRLREMSHRLLRQSK